MDMHRLLLKVAVLAVCSATPSLVLAQGADPAAPRNPASVPAPGARNPSAPAQGALRAGPRLSTPAERRESATPPGDLGPIGAPPPLINIPFGQPAATGKPAFAPAAQRDNSLPANAIDDEAARCQAQPDAPSREACRQEMARQARKH